MSRPSKISKPLNRAERSGASHAARTSARVESFAGRRIRILGVPLDLGQSRRGVDMGPSAVRVAGLQARLEALGHQVQDGGNISVEIAETQSMGEHDAKYLHAITETCTREAEQVIATLTAGETPLVLGGDHSIAVGTVSGVAEFYRRKEQKIGLIWMDAHADINTPQTSPSGNVHGMPVAALMGLGPDELKDILGGLQRWRRKTWCLSGCGILTRPRKRTSGGQELPRSTPCAILTNAACAQ